MQAGDLLNFFSHDPQKDQVHHIVMKNTYIAIQVL